MHVHPYERAWIVLAFVMLALFGSAVAVSNLAFGIRLPGVETLVAPVGAPSEATASQPWVRELGPGRYEVNLVAQVWSYAPAEIRVPKGAQVTFYLHSRDLVHGFLLEGTNVNMMVVPGRTGKVTHTFQKAGEYKIICNEYCGTGHHFMQGRVIVYEP